MQKCEGSISVRSVPSKRIKIWEKCKCLWTIKNFSKIKGDVKFSVRSPEFKANDASKYTWRFVLYPFGYDQKDKDFIGLFIHLASASKYPVTLKYSLSILNFNGSIIKNIKSKHEFSKITGTGVSRFINRNEMTSKIFKDVVEIAAEIFIGEILENVSEIEMDASSSYAVLLNAFSSMLNDEEFYDVALLTNGEGIKAHRIILSARSSVFSAMFKHENLESVTGNVEISDLNSHIIRTMVQFMYCGQIEITNVKMAMDLMQAADKYDLQDLKLLCADYLSMNIDRRNAEDVLLLADMTTSDTLKKDAIDFITRNPGKFTRLNRFSKLQTQNPRLLAELLVQKMIETSDHNNCEKDGADDIDFDDEEDGTS